MNSWPLACTKYKDGILKIVSARVCDENSDKEAGEIFALEKEKDLKFFAVRNIVHCNGTVPKQ